MRIGFFEEYPTKANLGKLQYVDFPTELIVAAPSLKEFLRIKKNINKYRQVKKVIYWPVLKKSEGYWFSRFSDPKAMQRIITAVQAYKKHIDIMWDLEFPIFDFWKPATYLNFFKTKKIMKQLLSLSSQRMLIATYPKTNSFLEFLLQSAQLRASRGQQIRMAYTSMIGRAHHAVKFLEHQLRDRPNMVGLGCIGQGILGIEPLISPEHLKRDLEFVKKHGVKKVFIYRLGGLDRQYISAIHQFLQAKV